MKICKCCGINEAIKYSKYSNGEFCSRKCARCFSSKEKRKEINEKVSKKLTGIKVEKRLSQEDWEKVIKKIKDFWDKKILEADYSELSFERLRRRILLEQNHKCAKCGIDEWYGEKITLEVEHIDGNHKNNARENLIAICPNCHSLTSTWRGRNKRHNDEKTSDKDLLDALIKYDFNIRQALLSVNLAAKGGNYNRCHKLKRLFFEIENK